ncbi:MAG: hypothetical protein KKD29_05805 [Candidatus Omnitrophica bacterium]|nr:hypothetical protein [Candidatus Omnitrophota bacterium]MBU4487988.1 hypothetical protein [Candidatus Omnitrophota bacterium]MCG2704769.1 hypothetical protein [Candidatus Omnitrophota bacterium]
MNKDIKSLGVVVFAAVFLFSTVVASLLFIGERNSKLFLQNELAEVMKAKKKLSFELDEVKVIKSDLELKLSALEAQAKMLGDSYEKEKAQGETIKRELSKKDSEIAGIKNQLDSAKNEKENLQSTLDEEKLKYSQLRERVDKLVAVKDELENKIKEIVGKQGVELERIVVKEEGELEGKVLVVNKEYNFIVTNAGSDDDIILGDIITVFRDGKYVGEAQVEKIYDTMSAATIVKETKPGAIQVNDKVVVRPK